MPAVQLHHVVSALGGPGVDLLTAPRGLEAPLRDVVIAEPCDTELLDRQGDLVLLIGARGRAALRALIAAGRAGAVAVAVKTGADDGEELRRAAAECGTALLAVDPRARWEQVESAARAVVDSVGGVPDPAELGTDGDLFSLAQTVATLTGGIVSIEDAANRVLAYSRSGDQVDELRRLSILGRVCPEEFLAVLRDWGVYTRLRGGEEIVAVRERPELGIRSRRVAGISAGSRLLGTIWVQEGQGPLEERTDRVLRGAARLAALLLVRGHGRAGPGSALREELVAGLLAGRLTAGSPAGQLGVAADSGATVMGLDLREREDATGSAGPELELRRTRAAGIVAVHAAAYRRSAVAARLDGRVYVLLPETPPGPGAQEPAAGSGSGAAGPRAGTAPSDPAVLAWAADLVSTLRSHLGTPVQGALARPVARLADAPTARRTADTVLDAMAGAPGRAVATYDDVRSSVALGAILELLDSRPDVRDPALDVLIERDRRQRTELASSLLLYLDAFGDVAKVAERLHIHPNTLRHRIRRAVSLSGLDLDDPEQRLMAMLQLRTAVGPTP